MFSKAGDAIGPLGLFPRGFPCVVPSRHVTILAAGRPSSAKNGLARAETSWLYRGAGQGFDGFLGRIGRGEAHTGWHLLWFIRVGTA